MGEREELRRLCSRGERTDSTWERRKAEQAARKAAVMADPVQGFYLRHGHPAARGAQVITPDAAAVTGDEEPETA